MSFPCWNIDGVEEMSMGRLGIGQFLLFSITSTSFIMAIWWVAPPAIITFRLPESKKEC